MEYIETDCTMTHEGHEYTLGGAVITENYLIAYPSANGVLNDWHGNAIGTWRTISKRPAIFFGYPSHWNNMYYYMRAKVNGHEYALRGFGEGMIAQGKRIKGT